MTMPRQAQNAAVTSPHGWRLGALAGTPVYLGRSWPIIAVVIVALFAPTLSRVRGPGYGLMVALAYAVLLLLSVLVHEAAHAFAARWAGHPVDRIVADVWGGHTVYDATRSRPTTTAFVAVVGPLANLGLAALGWWLGGLVDPGTTVALLVGVVSITNLFVGLFNLLPGLPLDGGQILSAVVWAATGSKGRGLTVAGWTGRLVPVLALAWIVVRPLIEGRQPDLTMVLWTVVIGAFLWQGASAAIRSGHIHEATDGPIEPVLAPVVLVSGTATLTVALGRAQAEGMPLVVATDASGHPAGVLDGRALTQVPASALDRTPLQAVVVGQPPEWVLELDSTAVLTDVVRLMSERSLTLAVVIDPATGRARGAISAERVNDVVGAELARRGRA